MRSWGGGRMRDPQDGQGCAGMEGESSGRGQGLDASKHSTVWGSVPPPRQASPLAFFPSFKAGSLGPDIILPPS